MAFNLLARHSACSLTESLVGDRGVTRVVTYTQHQWIDALPRGFPDSRQIQPTS